MDSLKLVWTEAENEPGQFFWDFVISGQSLYRRLRTHNVGILGSVRPEYEGAIVDQLLMNRRGDYPSGCVALYVCHLCSDIDCGAETAKISRNNDLVTWSDFRFVSNRYEDDASAIEGIGPFVFMYSQYSSAILERRK